MGGGLGKGKSGQGSNRQLRSDKAPEALGLAGARVQANKGRLGVAKATLQFVLP